MLNELGIAENTLVIAMADNGPMSHNPPPGLGMSETIFRGGKGDFLEGDVRVPAFAWWPGVIKPGQVVGDIIHETDFFTTFARLAGATEYIPTDRVIDGIDQTTLLINLIHLKSPFNRMKLRHDLWKKKYPDSHEVYGIPWTGIENAAPEIKALTKPQLDLKKLPFDPLEYIEHLDQLPFDPSMDPSLSN